MNKKESILNEVYISLELHINEELFKEGYITEEIYMKAKELIFKDRFF